MTETGLRRSAGPTLDGVLGALLDDLNLSAPPMGQVQIVGDAPLVSARYWDKPTVPAGASLAQWFAR
jgi:hypothetical protein